MRPARMLAAISCAAGLLVAAPAVPSAATGTLYQLSGSPSQNEFEWGCFGPCACPVMVRTPLNGTFVLSPSHTDPLYAWYDVLDVHWRVTDAAAPVVITGSGTYRLGGEVALMEELTLDLSFDGGPAQRFGSGLVSAGAPFPEIDSRISLHAQYCFDSVLVVDAKPIGVLGVGTGPQASDLVPAPNPFARSTQITFVQRRDGAVDLGVYDVTGRLVRALARHEWLPAGAYARSWDGRLEGGRDAAPGLYVLRLDSPSGALARALVKLP